MVTKGQALKINTQTSPTNNGMFILTTKVKEVLSNGNFITEDCEPYFGYNLFNIKDIVL